MDFSTLDLRPIWLSLQLAAYTVLILLLLGAPYAWWLSRTHSRVKVFLEALTALPLVLPPTVLGFYLLVLMGSQGLLGAAWVDWTGHTLAFSFAGLLIASCLYSLPFVVQPLQASFSAIDQHGIDAAWTLGASRLKAFLTITLPQARQGILAAIVLGFAHTLGEFGVVLMVGGNIPGETQVLAIAIYDQVEALEYQNAHLLSAGLLVFSFAVLAMVYGANRRWLIELRA